MNFFSQPKSWQVKYGSYEGVSSQGVTVHILVHCRLRCQAMSSCNSFVANKECAHLCPYRVHISEHPETYFDLKDPRICAHSRLLTFCAAWLLRVGPKRLAWSNFSHGLHLVTIETTTGTLYLQLPCALVLLWRKNTKKRRKNQIFLWLYLQRSILEMISDLSVICLQVIYWTWKLKEPGNSTPRTLWEASFLRTLSALRQCTWWGSSCQRLRHCQQMKGSNVWTHLETVVVLFSDG